MRFPNAHEQLTVKFQIAISGDGISNTFPTSNSIIISETINPSTDWHEIFTKTTMPTFDTLTVDQFNALTCRPQENSIINLIFKRSSVLFWIPKQRLFFKMVTSILMLIILLLRQRPTGMQPLPFQKLD